MKKQTEILLSVLLIAGMLLSLLPVSYLARPADENVMGMYAEEENTLDTIYIGGSACMLYWAPLRAWEQYGFTSYNFAVHTIPPQSLKYFMEEADKTQDPKLWIVDLRPFQYGDELVDGNPDPPMYWDAPIRNVTDSLHYSRNRYELVNACVRYPSQRLSYHFDLLKYHTELTSRLAALLRKPENARAYLTNEQKHPYKGFRFIERTEPVPFEDHSAVTDQTPLAPEMNRLFFDLLEHCKQRQWKVLFVIHSYNQQEDHKKKYNYMAQAVEEYGFDYLNLNDHHAQIGLDYTFDLYDDNHVNIFGAEKYTDYLAAYIQEHYQLPDHRGDAAYRSWQEDSDAFQAYAREAKQRILAMAQEKGD